MAKTAVITGASRGIGKAIALELAKAGNNIAIIDYCDEAISEQAVKDAESLGVSAKAYKCNVAELESCEETVKAILADFGSVDVLVNNAGITRDKLMLAMSGEDFDAVIDVNLKGVFNMIKSCYKTFMKQRSGKIINVSSVSGIMGNAGQTNYSASKAGIIGLTKSVAKELAKRNICCNAIAPGFVKTDMTKDFEGNEQVLSAIPLGRMAEPEEIARLAVFLSESDYITGEVIRIDGGMAM